MSVDFRIMRIVMESSNPIDTLQNFNSGKYSIKTFFQMLEILDAKETMQEDIEYRNKLKQKQQSREKR